MPFGIELFGRALARRTERGLYAGRKVIFGNKISEDGGNKSRRKWLPNVQKKKVFSKALNAFLTLRVTTGALRNIDKAGGLDRYVYKICGTQEDTQKAEQLRKQIDEQETARRTYALRAEELRRQQLKAETKALEVKPLRPQPRLMSEADRQTSIQ